MKEKIIDLNDRFLRMEEVLEKTGVTRKTIYRWQEKGLFPKSIKTGPNSIRFLQSEVNKWMLQCIANRESGINV